MTIDWRMKLISGTFNVYCEGAPVFIREGVKRVGVKDGDKVLEPDRMFFSIKSLSEKDIVFLTLEISCIDSESGEISKKLVRHWCENAFGFFYDSSDDMRDKIIEMIRNNTLPQVEQNVRKAIILDLSADYEKIGEKVKVRVTEVLFSDASWWVCGDDPWESFPEKAYLDYGIYRNLVREESYYLNRMISESYRRYLSLVLKGFSGPFDIFKDELEVDRHYISRGYRSVFGDKSQYTPYVYKDLWCCTCGEINKRVTSNCRHCNASFVALSAFDDQTARREGIFSQAMELYESGDLYQLYLALASFQFQDFLKLKDVKAEILECEAKIKETKKRNKFEKIKKVIKKTMLGIAIFIAAVAAIFGGIFAYCRINRSLGKYSPEIKFFNIEHFVVKEGTETIKSRAFYNCEYLKKVVIPEGVETVCDYAFYGCSALTEISIPKSVTSINENAFMFCSELTDIYYSGSEEDWGKLGIDIDSYFLSGVTVHYLE